MTGILRWLLHYTAPDDARAELKALRVNRSAEQYVNLIWRARGQPVKRAGKGWPFVRLEHQAENVTKLRKVRNV